MYSTAVNLRVDLVCVCASLPVSVVQRRVAWGRRLVSLPVSMEVLLTSI